MSNLRITEIKAFVPSKNFEISKQFYQDLGFTMILTMKVWPTFILRTLAFSFRTIV